MSDVKRHIQNCREFCQTCMSGDTCVDVMHDEPCRGALANALERADAVAEAARDMLLHPDHIRMRALVGAINAYDRGSD